MESIINYLKSITVLGIPLNLLSIALIIIIIALLFRRILTHVLIKRLNRLTEKTETQLDDMFLKSIEGPLSLAVLGFGIYLGRLIIYTHINENINLMIDKGFQLFFFILICW